MIDRPTASYVVTRYRIRRCTRTCAIRRGRCRSAFCSRRAICRRRRSGSFYRCRSRSGSKIARSTGLISRLDERTTIHRRNTTHSSETSVQVCLGCACGKSSGTWTIQRNSCTSVYQIDVFRSLSRNFCDKDANSHSTSGTSSRDERSVYAL